MNRSETQTEPRAAWPPFLVAIVVAGMLASFLAPMAPRLLAATDVGYADSSYSGASSPTGREPQSKLWFNDGIWWGSLYGSSSHHFDIHRLNWATQTWSDTGTLIDDRSKSSADMLWDGSKLYAVSAISDQSSSSSPPTGGDTSIRIMRYSYSSASKTYTVDAGFPVTVANAAVESVSLDKDSTGRIWVTWTYANGTGHRSVFVTHSTVNTATFVAPYVLPLTGAANLENSDYSAIVAYNGRIGVMWSNQTDATMYFAYHVDGASDTAWVESQALSGPGWVDNHMTIKSLQADSAGQVFAATKTSLNGDKCPPSSGNSQQPLILLLFMDGTGGWQRRTFSTAADCESRPIVVLDQQSRKIYLFATLPAPNSSYGSGGSIYYKSTSLDNPNFASGPGTPFIQLSANVKINNATSTKQSVSPATGLVVLAGDDHTKTYAHNAISLGSDTTPPSVTAMTPANGATNVPGSTAPTATFSEPMTASSLTSAFTLTDTTSSGAVSGTVGYDAPSQTASFTPSASLAAGHSFRATLGTGATDLAGNHLVAAVSWTFGVASGGDVTPPTVSLTAPADGSTVGGTGVTLSATASDNVSVDHVDFLVDGGVVATDSSSPYSFSWDSTTVTDGSHVITARAVDASFNSASDSHAVTVSNAPPPSGTLFSDDFETGNLSKWTTVNTGGGGSATVQGGTVHGGAFAARLTESGTGGAYANVRETFAGDETDLTLTGDFRIAGEGSSNQNIPLFRLFDASGKRQLSLYRQDGSGGVHVWDGTGYHSTSGSISLNTWAHVEMHVIAGNGSGIATVELRLDGALIYAVTNATLPPVRTVQIGNETKNQPMDLYVDNIGIDGPGGAPEAPDTTITSGPSGVVTTNGASFSFSSTISGSTFACSLDGAAFSACTSPKAYSGLADGAHSFAVAATAAGVTDPSPATAGWTVDTTPASGALFSDDFESGNLTAWSTVGTGGGGTATVQSGTVHDGTFAAHLTESSAGSSYAYLRASMGTDQNELTISEDLRIAGEGSSNQNIPLIRLFDAGGTRRLSLYRQDVSGGIYVWDATGYHATGQSLSLNTWAHVEMHVIAGNGSGIATVELRLDGALIYSVTNATLPPVRTVQIGNETKNQPMDLYVDNVDVVGP